MCFKTLEQQNQSEYLQTLHLGCDILSPNVRTVAVKEHSLEELDPEDAEDEEEGAADDDDVADGLEAGEQSLHHQLEARSPGNDIMVMVKKNPFSLRTDNDLFMTRRGRRALIRRNTRSIRSRRSFVPRKGIC